MSKSMKTNIDLFSMMLYLNLVFMMLFFEMNFFFMEMKIFSIIIMIFFLGGLNLLIILGSSLLNYKKMKKLNFFFIFLFFFIVFNFDMFFSLDFFFSLYFLFLIFFMFLFCFFLCKMMLFKKQSSLKM